MSSSTIGRPTSRPIATAVEVGPDRLRVALSDDRELTVPIEWFAWLASASDEERSDWTLIEGGAGIWWNRLEESLSVAGLLGLRETA
jgi:hypothetical protein